MDRLPNSATLLRMRRTGVTQLRKLGHVLLSAEVTQCFRPSSASADFRLRSALASIAGLMSIPTTLVLGG